MIPASACIGRSFQFYSVEFKSPCIFYCGIYKATYGDIVERMKRTAINIIQLLGQVGGGTMREGEQNALNT